MTEIEKNQERYSQLNGLLLGNFAFILGHLRGIIHQVQKDEDALHKLAQSGVSRADIDALYAASKKISGAFYNKA